MRKFRFLSAVCYLGVGIWLNTSSLDRVTAQSSSKAFPLKIVQSQPQSSNTPRFNTDSSGIEVKSSFSLLPIYQACPFPAIPTSEAANNALVGEITSASGAISSSSFVPGDGSDADLDSTVSDLVETRKLDEALQVAQKIQDVSQKNQALRRIASAYSETGQLEQAFQVAKRITEPPQLDNSSSDDHISLRDNALVEIAQAYLKTGQLEQALQVAEVMGEGFRVTTLLNIAEKYRVAGQSARATKVIDRAVAAYRIDDSLAGYDPVVATYLKVIVLTRFVMQYVSVGQKEQAVKLSPEILEMAKMLPQQNFLTLSALSVIADLYTSVGQNDKAASVLNYALKSARNIKEVFLKAFALAQIANSYAVLKQPDQATKLLSQALELAKPEKDVSKKSLVLIMSSRSYAVLGQYDKALQVTNVVEPTSLRDQVKQTLACSRKAAR